ncbi:SprT family protein [Staphylococcus saccharolyticus]|uniref:SprT family protein n=1 Tax=Staphylococcus saccharolyticus TaxID=33028 RepID=UPI0032DF9FDF
MNNDELQQLTEMIAMNFFGKHFKHQIYFNSRLRSTGGRYLLETHNLEINPKQLESFGEQAITDIIKHELCHYFLHLEGKGYQHRNKDFKVLSAKVGAPRFCKSTETYQCRANYKYICAKCKQCYLRIRRVNIKIMRCGHCGGRLKF